MMPQLPLWPYLPTFLRLIEALVIGLFVGIERERRGKEAGLRTFAFATLLGAVGGLLGTPYALLALALDGVLVVLLNVDTIHQGEGAELTTSAALLVVGFAGVLAGGGHIFTSTALGVLTAALLAWKEPLAGFSRTLTESEIRSAALLAILAFVIYPVLPTGSVDPWHLVNLRTAWVTVVLIASLGFVNYILFKRYGTRGLELTGFLGGFVNSMATVAELATEARSIGPALSEVTYRGVVLAMGAMLIRNAVILGLFAPNALLSALIPFGIMSVATLLVALQWRMGRLSWRWPGWWVKGGERGRASNSGVTAATSALPPDTGTSAVSTPAGPVLLPQLASPFSLSSALEFGAIFLVLQVAEVLAQRTLGHAGFYAVSLIGGVVSSASAVASAATLSAAGTIPPTVAGLGAALAAIVSVLVTLPLVARFSRNRVLTRRVGWVMGGVVLLGLLGVGVQWALSQTAPTIFSTLP